MLITAPPGAMAPQASALSPVDRVNALIHDAWRVAAGVLVDPATAGRARFLAGVRAAREGAALLRTVTPNRPGEGWLDRAARAIERGAANLQDCADLSANVAGAPIDIDGLMRHCEQAEGDFDYAWEQIAGDA